MPAESEHQGRAETVATAASVELVDVVDDHDRVIATVTRADMRAHRLLHRAVAIAVLSSDRRLLVHRRAEHKDVWPGMWDVAAGGVVGAGEDYGDAAVRELAEELGVEDVPLESLGAGRFEDEAVAMLGRSYAVVHDGPFAFADGEIAEVRWVDRSGFAELRSVERFVPDNLELLVPLLGDRWR